MIKNPEEMLAEFVNSDEFKRRSNLSEDQLSSIKLREVANDPLTDSLRSLVREFSKNSENPRSVVRSIYAVISSNSNSIGEDAP